MYAFLRARPRRRFEFLEPRLAPSETLFIAAAAIAASQPEARFIAPPRYAEQMHWIPEKMEVQSIIPPTRSNSITIKPESIDGLLSDETDIELDQLGETLGPDFQAPEPTSHRPAAPLSLGAGASSSPAAPGGPAAPGAGGGGGGGGGGGSHKDPAASAGAQQMAQAPTPHSSGTLSPLDYTPPPPTAYDDTQANGVDYWTYHDSAYTSDGSVQDNDANGTPVTSVLDSTVADGTLTLNSDGTFYYVPGYHFYGVDHFTYHNVNDFGSSGTATVDIRVSEYAPESWSDGIDDAGNYQYQVSWNETDADHNQFMLQGGRDQNADPPPIQTNDNDPDGPDEFNLTSILDSGPQHGTIARYSNPDATGEIDPDGGFIYTPAKGFSGIDQFTYHDTDGILPSDPPATVSILVQKVDLEMWDGGDWNDPMSRPNEVPAEKELSRGAFTVANYNDTNGDGTLDNEQNPVAATPSGRADVDLMKIVINPPNPLPQGQTSVQLSLSPELDLWRTSSKTDSYPHSGDISTGETTSIDVSLLPMTLWVESVSSSLELRDRGVQLSYNNATDLVHVTGIFAGVGVTTARETSDQIFADNSDLDPNSAPGPAISTFGGTGLIPVDTTNVDNVVGVRNGILIKYDILPRIPTNPNPADQETWEGDGVMFDATRQAEMNQWVQQNQGGAYAQQDNPQRIMPTFSEESNDDSTSSTDESQAVTPSGTFFAYDASGLPSNVPNAPANEFIWQIHAFDFLRVSFNGNRPDGDTVAGSRVSYMAEWWSQISVTTSTVMINGQPTTLWTRNGAAHVNYIGTLEAFDHLGPPF